MKGLLALLRQEAARQEAEATARQAARQPKMAGALKAVIKMHSDTSKLLIDCDKHIGAGRKSGVRKN